MWAQARVACAHTKSRTVKAEEARQLGWPAACAGLEQEAARDAFTETNPKSNKRMDLTCVLHTT